LLFAPFAMVRSSLSFFFLIDGPGGSFFFSHLFFHFFLTTFYSFTPGSPSFSLELIFHSLSCQSNPHDSFLFFFLGHRYQPSAIGRFLSPFLNHQLVFCHAVPFHPPHLRFISVRCFFFGSTFPEFNPKFLSHLGLNVLGFPPFHFFRVPWHHMDSESLVLY